MDYTCYPFLDISTHSCLKHATLELYVCIIVASASPFLRNNFFLTYKEVSLLMQRLFPGLSKS
jgi:hypothetical protein